MAETKTDKEPSIEEILESIRQIISEDDGTAQQAGTAQAAPAPVPPPPPAQDEGMPVLELTDKVEPQMDSDFEMPAVKAEPVPAPKPVSPPAPSGDGLLSDTTAAASAAAMAKLLTGNVAVENDVPGRVGNVTLEDMAKELMRPLIKTWLDQNLPSVIEKMVQKEIERISRKALNQ